MVKMILYFTGKEKLEVFYIDNAQFTANNSAC